ncbi:MAG: hypothetical protein M0R41_07030 [Methylobacter tundripaludum]|uniref:Uncharacterized protein n=1 Tax=Methylobacter tundripaludum TaxID=173365 RepID=A0A2S6H4I6_9GAMM|nr:hypothetical protein [Methylobacter tundripaludum]MCK9636015.1 hypothetical protein [Methylobacter tundripaludum]PPK72402.1 hypothetical protein B0F88_104196 [Methylobacter tundripaludum]
MSNDLKSKITDSLSSGTTIDWDYKTIAAEQNIAGAVFPVTVKIGLEVDSPYLLSGVFSGQSLLALIPPSLLPLGSITLDSVVFDLFTANETIGGIHGYLSLGAGGTGLTWNIATVGTNEFAVNLSGLSVSWITPQNPAASFLTVSAFGFVKIGAFNLEVVVSFPEAEVQIFQPPSENLNLGAFFSHFGLTSVEFLDSLVLENFNLVVDGSSKSVELFADIEVVQTASASSGENALTLIRGVDSSPAVLGIAGLAVQFSAAGGAVNASLLGELLCLGKLALSAKVAIDTGTGTWTFDGYLDIQKTWNNLNPGVKPPKTYSITLPYLADIFVSGASSYIPSALNDFSIAALSVDYTYVKGGDNSAYAFNGVFDGNWTLDSAGEISAELQITLGSSQNKVSADFEMDGFEFTLSCDLTKTTKEISASISDEIDGQQLAASGTYTDNAAASPPNKTATFTITSLPSLGALMAWFVAKVTDNPFFILPAPWFGLLNDISFDSVLSDVTFEIEIVPPHDAITNTQKIVSCTLTPSNTIFGVTITGITLKYDSAQKAQGNSGLSFAIAYSGTIPFLTQNPISWDPVNEQPPAVPGKGASIIDIELLALGQHIEFNDNPTPAWPSTYTVPPTTVEQAVADLGYAISQLSGTSSPAMAFAKDGGWLVGAYAKFLGQADVQFIFDDPRMYGLMVNVATGKNATLNKLAGLYAEILYRKVSETVGEYEGFLTLPTKIRTMQFGNAFVTLPSISVSIYTNGDFSFNIGFPYNLDFSHSFSVTADSFTGAGGFYFAKLNGLHPKALPDATNGNFNPITEIGVGLRVGRGIAFHKGPLSASASIVLEALFQGIFAKFTPSIGGEDYEYYDICAAVEIVGHIQGSINFAIIQASLNVTAFIRADATLIAYQPCHVSVTASIDVAITVSIDLGLFTIHIHCHFSTTFHTQATLSSLQQGSAPWIVVHHQPSPPRLPEMAFLMESLPAAPAALLSLKNHAAPMAPPPRVTWQPLTASSSKALNIDILPQPTSTGTGDWYYVCQFAMNLEEAGNDSYQNFVEGLLVWALYATTNPASPSAYSDVVGTGSGTSTPITLANIKAFTKALNNKPITAANPYNYSSVAPTLADVQALFYQATANTALFDITIKEPAAPSSGSQYKAVFFPILPGTTVTLTSSKELTQTAPTPEPVPPAADIITNQQNIFIEFIMLTVSNAMDKAEELGVFASDGTSTIYDVITALEAKPSGTPTPQPYYDSIAGLTTRFMLHGTRYNGEALYVATGQQMPITFNVPSGSKANPSATTPALSISMNVNCPDAASWGTTFSPLFMCSSTAANSSLIRQPSDFVGTGAPTLDTAEFASSGLMPLAHPPENKQYQLKVGIDTGASSSLWHFPVSLINGLSSGSVLPANCSLNAATINLQTGVVDGTGTAPSAPANCYVTTVEFKIKKIPLPTAKGQKIAYLKNTYQLGQVNPLGLVRLERLINDIATANPIYNLQLSYVSNGEAVLTTIGGDVLFILQSDFSTEISSTVPANNTSPDFVYKLWTGGVTNTGGDYLYWDGVPDTLFDTNGVAEISLVVTLTGITAYTTGVLLSEPTSTYSGANKTSNLYIEDSGEQVVRAYFDPGKVPMRVTRNVPAPQNPVPFASTLNHTYNLLNASFGGVATTISPKNKSKTDINTWYYDHVFSPVTPFVPDGSGTPPTSMNPYQDIVSQTVPTFTLIPVDLFGNEWSAITPATVPTGAMLYTDPVISLKQLPYLHIDYSFDAQGNIDLNFDFDFEGYGSEAGQAPLAHQKADLWAYAKAIYQLSDPATTATVSTSFATNVDSNKVKSGIQTNLGAIYKALDTNAPLSTPLSPVAVVVTAASINPNTYFALNVNLTLERTQYVDPAFSVDPRITSSVMTASPHSLVNKGTDTSPNYQNDLKPFATAFETAYATENMKIAVGAIDRKGAAPNAHQVWVVRYGASGDIDISFVTTGSTPVYYCYSPKPLSNKLLSRANIPVATVSGGVTTPSTATATNVDLDAEMQAFLKALDTMFTPEMMTPAAIINPGAISKLAGHKKTIVSNLINYVTYSPGSGSGIKAALAAAREMYRQECLKELGNFYKMDAVAVLETSANSGFTSTINFLGTPVPSKVTKAEATLTTGKAAVPISNGQSYMALGIFPKQLSKHSTYTADLSFKLTALEHDIEQITINEDGSSAIYNAGSWFKFVNEPDPIDIGSIAVPMPLRAFPTPPRLGRLYADDLANVDKPVTDQNEEMMYAKAWSLNGEYSHSYVAQDSLGLEVSINKGISDQSEPQPVTPPSSPDLLDALVQFRTVYPSLKGTLDTLSTTQSPSKGQSPLSDAIEHFAKLVKHVANYSWPTAGGATPAVNYLKSSFKVTEKADKTSGDWTVTVESTDSSNSLGFVPQLKISGYTSSVDGTPADSTQSVTYIYSPDSEVTTNSPESIEERTVVVAPAQSLIPSWPFAKSATNIPFNILTHQDGIIAMKVMRNMSLAQEFHYETSEVSYKSILYPLLVTDAPIDIGALSGTGDSSLTGRLTNLFNALLMDYSTDAKQTIGQFQVVVTFNYLSNSSSAFAIKPVSVPVMMRVPTDFTNDSYIGDMESAITSWITANYGSFSNLTNNSNLIDAYFNFDISLFSGSSKSGNPILRIQKAQLKCSDM